MAETAISQDRWNLRPIIAPVAIAMFVGAAFSLLQLPYFEGAWIWFGLVCAVLGLPALLAWLVKRLARFIIAAARRMWKRAASQLILLLVAPLLVAVALLNGTYVHFAFSYPYYLWRVMQPPDAGTKPASFYWGGAGFVGAPQTDRWLVYDPTDETAARPKLSQSEEDPTVWYEVQHLIGRFYLVQRHQP